MQDTTNIEQYVKLALKTENLDFEGIARRMGFPVPKDVGVSVEGVQTIRLMHALMGMQTEIGELVDQLKRHLFYGTELDWTNIIEETGDGAWYLAVLSDIIQQETGVSLMTIMCRNINKLAERYPDKFKESDAVVRDLDAERKELEKS